MKRLRTERIRHTRYDEEFKTQAVRMCVDSGTSPERTAKELGVSVFDLYKWGLDMKELKKEELERKPRTLAEYKQKAKRLEKELARVTEHREILKKAAGILSQTPPSDMP